MKTDETAKATPKEAAKSTPPKQDLEKRKPAERCSERASEHVAELGYN